VLTSLVNKSFSGVGYSSIFCEPTALCAALKVTRADPAKSLSRQVIH